MSDRNAITEDELLEAVSDTMTPLEVARAVLRLVGVTVHEKPIESKQEVLPMESVPKMTGQPILLYTDAGEDVAPNVDLVYWSAQSGAFQNTRGYSVLGKRLGWAPIPRLHRPDQLASE